MDFITGLARYRTQHDSIWVIVDRMTKSSHFLPVKTTYSAQDYVRLYIQEIVRIHGVSVSILSDRSPYRISKRIVIVAYELELPSELASFHQVFHFSMLKNCMGDP
ncbi:hypothetical protein MTR67_026024 [Solanum verrucosum]|uniref:Tf2-1-like SH3-like domain-containing protein n=1 Tax=Solanum verrucosum TaxID=315347 RepID=A0AAF0QY67_SOLVR|nr:hypothetical protein MTR67_026024 [Solanum verrucosum]